MKTPSLPALLLLALTACGPAPSGDAPAADGAGLPNAAAAVGAASANAAAAHPEAAAAVDSVLDALHRLAAEGDFDTYFGLLTPDAVFMGTDATERWSVDEFRGYAAGSSGWTYHTTERHVFVDADGSTAWFDERLHNARYGETRGTGVLVRTPADGWKIAQYNLTIPVPNALALELVERIREVEGEDGVRSP
ncbi:MAG: nuclear transport factor 2 family protein [Longimicrobiales bacterium]|nr:nuclear transport factor 2 family protein [Longimicrobiales bacterium]